MICTLTRAHWQQASKLTTPLSAVSSFLMRNTKIFHCYCVQPFSTCRIGSPGPHYTTEVHHDNSTKVDQKKVSVSPLKALFGGVAKSVTPPPTVGVTLLPAGSQDEYWGPPITIHGRVSTVSVFNDVVQTTQFRALNMSGQFCFTQRLSGRGNRNTVWKWATPKKSRMDFTVLSQHYAKLTKKM